MIYVCKVRLIIQISVNFYVFYFDIWVNENIWQSFNVKLTDNKTIAIKRLWKYKSSNVCSNHRTLIFSLKYKS